MTSDTRTRIPAPGEKDAPDRRKFLRRATGLGAGVVATIAATWADAPSAFAAPGCCDLAHPNGPWCGGAPENDGNFSCPHGYTKHAWYCNIGQMFYYSCWECAKGSNCYAGPWACSNYYIVYVP